MAALEEEGLEEAIALQAEEETQQIAALDQEGLEEARCFNIKLFFKSGVSLRDKNTYKIKLIHTIATYLGVPSS
jgi:hypothetical protein